MASGQLPELSGVTPRLFIEEIVPTGRPVILRGLIKDWPIVDWADDARKVTDYLKQHIAPKPVTVSRIEASQGGRFFYQEDMRNLNFSSNNVRFEDFISLLLAGANGDTLYMASTPAREAFPAIAQMFTLPHVPEDTIPRIFIGNKTIISTHNDGSSNIACIAAGQRIFTLFPPEQLVNLYPGPIEHTPAGPQMSMVDVADPDPERFPRFPEAMKTAQIGELGPGDGIYIPPLWWHDVRAQSDFNILVNYWWKDRPNIGLESMPAFMLSLLSLRQLPEQERAAWKSMFDYYVFQTDGEPMAHLPHEYQGILGPIDEARASQIWEFFRKAIE